jgi:phosphoribosylanthranilate isomerase
MVKVKICGIRTLEDALMAVRLGADAFGVLVGQRYASPDFLKVDIARDIVSALPPFCSSVLVTHLSHAIEILPLLDHVPVTNVQLHSDISPEDCSALKQRHPNRKYIKSIHVIDETSLHIQDPYLDIVDALLLDTVNPSTGQIGGRFGARLVPKCSLGCFKPTTSYSRGRLDRGQCEFRYRRSSSLWSRC